MIYALPGLGASSAMYAGPWQQLQDAKFLDWPKITCPSLQALAEHFVEENGIQDGDTIIGTSMGGMVGCEIASLVKLNTLVLVSSAKSPKEINPLLKLLHPIANKTPLEFLRLSAGKIPTELAAMFVQHEPTFIYESIRAIFGWEGLQTQVNVVRVHGSKDLVIAPPKGADHLINGGHLITMTHADECMAFVQPFLEATK